MAEINLTKLMRQARLVTRAEYVEGEKERIGTLRAGNSGIASSTGQIAGKCARVTHLRSLGVELEEPTFSNMIMFERGYNNEDLIYQDLAKVLNPSSLDGSYGAGEDLLKATGGLDPKSLVILREEEIPISWTTKNGTLVTGRPDMVICQREVRPGTESSLESDCKLNGEEDGLFCSTHGELCGLIPDIVTTTPILGIEIKSVASFWTSRDLILEGEPNLEHFAQAAHYMWQLGKQTPSGVIPYRLIYRQYALHLIPEWMKSKVPQPGQPKSEFFDYFDKPLKINGREIPGKVEPKCVKPYEIVYELEFRDDSKGNGRLHFRLEGTTEWESTVIVREDIERYYNITAEIGTSKQLPARPITVNHKGEEKNYSKCDYCVLQKTCDRLESRGYDSWLEGVKQFSEERREGK